MPEIKKLELDDPETKSADMVAENLDTLRSLFPDAFREGKIDFEVLKQLLGGAIDERDEKYGLNWHGKRQARQIALTPSTGTLLPCPEESVDWDTTQNLMIEGDNLEVLKLLKKSYASKVKLIYIDPPYNTGDDFVYQDDYADNLKNYLSITGQIDEGGQKITSNTESSGRFHTNWLNMIYPRIKTARELLSKDGSIWVSVDGKELDNLSSVLKEIFGTENFVGSFIWEKRLTRENRKVYSVNHDYILCATKDRVAFERIRGMLPLSSEVEDRYSNPDNDPRGPWQSVSLNAQSGHATKDQFYTFTTPGGRLIELPPGRCWSVIKPKLLEMIADNRVWFGVDGNNVPREKLFLSEAKNGLVPHTLWTAAEVGTTDGAKRDMISLFDEKDVFDTPKPVGLLQRIIEIGSAGDEIVMDFFAGSGTTAEAVWTESARSNSPKRFILVQLPEPLDLDNKNQKEAAKFCDQLGVPRNIAELTKERLRRSAKKVRKDNPGLKGDYGFRVYTLASSNIRAWEPNPTDLEGTLLANAEHLVQDRAEQDVLYELLLKLGLDLCVPIATKNVAGKAVHSIGGGTLIVCLADGLTKDVVESVATGIVAWWKTLAPAVDTRIVFKDSGFADDVAKTNMAAILNQNGILDVRSI
jgi:adenine-specific DNA-methyltransferase